MVGHLVCKGPVHIGVQCMVGGNLTIGAFVFYVARLPGKHHPKAFSLQGHLGRLQLDRQVLPIETFARSKGAESLDPMGEVRNHLYEAGPLGRRDPFQGEPFRMDPKIRQNTPDQVEFVDGLVITVPVMALAQVSAADKNAVCPVNETVYEKQGINATGAHDPNDPDMGRILESGYSGRVRCGIAAPMAQKAEDSGFESVIRHDGSLLSPKAAICALICSRVKRPMEMAMVGQYEAQTPHPLQAALITFALLSFSTFSRRIALKGHKCSQTPHPIQAWISQDATMGSAVT